jgi:hypothetical protein
VLDGLKDALAGTAAARSTVLDPTCARPSRRYGAQGVEPQELRSINNRGVGQFQMAKVGQFLVAKITHFSHAWGWLWSATTERRPSGDNGLTGITDSIESTRSASTLQ